MPTDEDIDGAILFLESADGSTYSWIADYVLTGFGERGWFDRFKAVLVGRPKAWELNLQINPGQKAEYRRQQRDVILKTVRGYNPDIPVVQNLDFGHTDPQIALPKGNIARVVSSDKKVYLNY